jgi:hypothetical protein
MAMHLRKKIFLIITTGLFMGTGFTLGQSAYDLNFQGMLSDIQGNPIHDEPFNLRVQLLSEDTGEALFEFSSSATTDEYGWFGFTISEISRYLMEGRELKHSAVIRMQMEPNEETRWLAEGEDFLVTYALTPATMGHATQLKITRMEGSELMVHSEDHLFAYKDQYPFAYLTGGFLMTDQPPVSEQSIADLKQWLMPGEEDGDGTPSRGVKGGFPQGGYYKKY